MIEFKEFTRRTISPIGSSYYSIEDRKDPTRPLFLGRIENIKGRYHLIPYQNKNQTVFFTSSELSKIAKFIEEIELKEACNAQETPTKETIEETHQTDHPNEA